MFAFPPIPPAAQAWAQPLAEAAVARLALFINHVLASEAIATQRLQPHAGRVLAVQMKNWPAVLPPWPPLVFRITPAGLMEWAGAGADAVAAEAADLRVSLDASNPALLMWQTMASQFGQPRPAMEVAGDAALAADVSWLADNLRWDLEDDLARLVGDGPAHELARWGAWVAEALRGVASGATAMAAKAGGAGKSGQP
jgi:ubiquinone biosynthesis protein UbiJ